MPRRTILPPTSPSAASMSLPSTRARNGARRAFPRTPPRATASGWPRSSPPAASVRKPPRTARNRARKMRTKRSRSSVRSVTSCKRTRPSTTTSSTAWGRGSTTRSSCRRSPRPGRKGSPTKPFGTRSAADGNRPVRHRGNTPHRSALTVHRIGQAVEKSLSCPVPTAVSRLQCSLLQPWSNR
jgi:hypothetical protein